MNEPKPFFSPVCNFKDIDRLELVDWKQVHDAVQVVLSNMDESVRVVVPTAVIQVGHNSARAWSLYTYRVYSLPDVDVDPVVVGIFFVPTESETIITADICGETLGDRLLNLLPIHAKMGSIIEMAHNLAHELVEKHDIVARALLDHERKPK